MAYTIKEFCKAYGFSHAHYYNLKKVGKGPREMKLGRRRAISDEAAADWEKEREAESAAA